MLSKDFLKPVFFKNRRAVLMFSTINSSNRLIIFELYSGIILLSLLLPNEDGIKYSLPFDLSIIDLFILPRKIVQVNVSSG